MHTKAEVSSVVNLKRRTFLDNPLPILARENRQSTYVDFVPTFRGTAATSLTLQNTSDALMRHAMLRSAQMSRYYTLLLPHGSRTSVKPFCEKNWCSGADSLIVLAR